MFNTTDIPKSSRIPKLIEALYAKMPVIESARAKLITESYKATEGQPVITRRAEAFAHILRNIPIIIRDNELMNGWRLNWILLQQEQRIRSTLLKRPKQS